MRTKFLSTLLFVLVFGIKTIVAQSTPNQMAIEIIPADYTKAYEITYFTEGSKPFTNAGSTITWKSFSAPGFEGYQFFSTNNSDAYKGKIVPSETGEIYIVGSEGAETQLNTLGWTKTANTGYYENSTGSAKATVFIFKKDVALGDTISIPEFNYYAGFSPLAYTMSIKDAASGVEKVYGKNVTKFIVSNKELKLTDSGLHATELKVYDLTGKIVYNKNMAHVGEVIPLRFLEKGIYVAKYRIEGMIYSQKIMI